MSLGLRMAMDGAKAQMALEMIFSVLEILNRELEETSLIEVTEEWPNELIQYIRGLETENLKSGRMIEIPEEGE